LSWGYQPIPQPIEDLDDLKIFTYEKKQRSIVKINHRKRKVTLDSGVLRRITEVIIDIKKAKASQLYSKFLAISHASYDKEVVEERELEQARVEIASLKHHVRYHQEAGGETKFKVDLLEINDRCIKVQEDLIMKEVDM
jgi:hypothetical protein